MRTADEKVVRRDGLHCQLGDVASKAWPGRRCHLECRGTRRGEFIRIDAAAAILVILLEQLLAALFGRAQAVGQRSAKYRQRAAPASHLRS